MTLTEYLNQEIPKRYPIVTLQEGEFEVGLSIHAGMSKLTLITIPILHEKFHVSGEYIQLNDQSYLRTTDESGNPRNISVFHLPNQD